MPSDTSIRERILLAVLAAVRPAAEQLGATLHRSPTVAIGREHCPALVVFPESEAITERANDCVTRELTVRLVALARAVPPTAPETEADRLLTAAHARPDGGREPGGLALWASASRTASGRSRTPMPWPPPSRRATASPTARSPTIFPSQDEPHDPRPTDPPAHPRRQLPTRPGSGSRSMPPPPRGSSPTTSPPGPKRQARQD